MPGTVCADASWRDRRQSAPRPPSRDGLEEAPAVHAITAFESEVMDRVRVSASDAAGPAHQARQATFPYLLLSTAAVGMMFIVTGYIFLAL